MRDREEIMNVFPLHLSSLTRIPNNRDRQLLLILEVLLDIREQNATLIELQKPKETWKAGPK